MVARPLMETSSATERSERMSTEIVAINRDLTRAFIVVGGL